MAPKEAPQAGGDSYLGSLPGRHQIKGGDVAGLEIDHTDGVVVAVRHVHVGPVRVKSVGGGKRRAERGGGHRGGRGK